VEVKVSKLEERTMSLESTMARKLGILNMVSKTYFQNFKEHLKENVKDDLKEMGSKYDLKEMA
jgi:hypothetical protein